MSFEAKPAKRENVGLIIGFVGPTGSGKTFSALRAASGLVKPGERFVVIDTESRRALHYADDFKFDHVEFGPPFSPERYREAMVEQIRKGYRVIVVDSMSHEHIGEGGVLEMHEAELDRMAGKVPENGGGYDWKKRERCGQAAWVRPKMARSKMVQKIQTTPPGTHLILCFRAKEKTQQVKGRDGKTEFVPMKKPIGRDGWMPQCGEEIPYEMTVSLLFLADAPGVPKPIKLPEPLKPLIPLDRTLDETVGRKLAEWAAGGEAPAPPAPAPKPEPAAEKAAAAPTERTVERISAVQVVAINALLRDAGSEVETRMLDSLQVDCVEAIPAADFDRVMKRLELSKKKAAS